ncbi:uncharacterized protein I303_106023 [Kwoniella dejecticola CBS 10117]|uniref:Uncharacterized protein n=1 Tax=Kwoniella dejecticola CBS 10117 TaxID=1296121 RepID=A0A1A6A121_9TREE|nr:uncharacterized protein I303_06043 [Kwoniella dejecticola CBS 10117]OBR83761.1 hypothetical protein I303_06043 [Kwoniella dejecticola CBS 10117]
MYVASNAKLVAQKDDLRWIEGAHTHSHTPPILIAPSPPSPWSCTIPINSYQLCGINEPKTFFNGPSLSSSTLYITDSTTRTMGSTHSAPTKPVMAQNLSTFAEQCLELALAKSDLIRSTKCAEDSKSRSRNVIQTHNDQVQNQQNEAALKVEAEEAMNAKGKNADADDAQLPYTHHINNALSQSAPVFGGDCRYHLTLKLNKAQEERHDPRPPTPTPTSTLRDIKMHLDRSEPGTIQDGISKSQIELYDSMEVMGRVATE